MAMVITLELRILANLKTGEDKMQDKASKGVNSGGREGKEKIRED